MAHRQYVCEGDINRLNNTWHVVGVLDSEKLQRSRLLLPRRVTLGLLSPPILLSYIREDGFRHAVDLRDFMFDNSLISAFVERWRPETHTFHLPWGEASITLQDVAYHIGLHTTGESRTPDMGVG
ncbi:uncharacterized protein DS421_1g02590 [Arachis hypogaea]|nr:uncharacterized protein DS421_1g02590 [Arachis hypogaea]